MPVEDHWLVVKNFVNKQFSVKERLIFRMFFALAIFFSYRIYCVIPLASYYLYFAFLAHL